MPKRLPITPNSKIRNSLNKLFLTSRERQEAIKRDKYTCQVCGAKQSRRKGAEVFVQVHHLHPKARMWAILFTIIRKWLLCDPKYLVTVCKVCHDKIHAED